MARVDVLDLVTTLSAGLADAVVCDGVYNELVQVIAATSEQLVASTLLPVAQEQATFQLLDQHVNLLAAFFGGRQLSPTLARQLDAITPTWRDVAGSPSSYIEETEADQTFRVYPKPQSPSWGFDFSPTGTPLGQDYPTDAVHVLVTDRREDLPDELELPVACLILEREFARVSNHSNLALARLYGDFGRLLLTWLA